MLSKKEKTYFVLVGMIVRFSVCESDSLYSGNQSGYQRDRALQQFRNL